MLLTQEIGVDCRLGRGCGPGELAAAPCPAPGTQALLLGVAGLESLQTVPEHGDLQVPGVGPALQLRPKRKYGAIAPFLPSKPQVSKAVMLDTSINTILQAPTAAPATARSISVPTPASDSATAGEDSLTPLTPPPGRKHGLLDSFRPRSKSDATSRSSKRPSFLAQLARKSVSLTTTIELWPKPLCVTV